MFHRFFLPGFLDISTPFPISSNNNPKESGRMGAKLLGLVTKRDADFVEAITGREVGGIWNQKLLGFLTLPNTNIAPDGFEVVAVVARPFGNLRQAPKNGKSM